MTGSASEAGATEATGARFPGRAPIDAYGNGGFRFADMSHRGSILCLPAAVVAWPPISAEALRQEDFAAVIAERDDIQLLLLGTGVKQIFPSQDLRAYFRSAEITLEAMATGAACRTYNVLLAERRPIAAALIAVP